MSFLKKMSIKAKMLFTAVLAVFGFFAFIIIRGKLRAKDSLSYELAKVKNEIEIANLEKESKLNDAKIEELKKQENVIKKKIEILEEKEIEHGRELSLEELDSFFKERGL